MLPHENMIRASINSQKSVEIRLNNETNVAAINTPRIFSTVLAADLQTAALSRSAPRYKSGGAFEKLISRIMPQTH
jgi:hypothetical protein